MLEGLGLWLGLWLGLPVVPSSLDASNVGGSGLVGSSVPACGCFSLATLCKL